jgi:hypothetical protein
MLRRYLLTAFLFGPLAFLAAGCDEKKPDAVEVTLTVKAANR